jgi:hypothetical protein
LPKTKAIVGDLQTVAQQLVDEAGEISALNDLRYRCKLTGGGVIDALVEVKHATKSSTNPEAIAKLQQAAEKVNINGNCDVVPL